MTQNILSIQFLRFVAATLVVCDHFAFGFQRFFEASVSPWFMYLTGFGACGVHIFFVISGFVMLYTSFSADKTGFNSSAFLLRRLIRIYPIYWIYASIYIAAHYMMGSPYILSVGEIVGAYGLLPSEASNVIGPGWTLSYELYFYLCFAVAMRFGFRLGMTVLGAYFAISIVVGIAIRPAPETVAHVFTNSLLLEFLAGVFIGYLVVSKFSPNAIIARGMIACGLVGFCFGFALGYQRLPALLTWGVPSTLLVAGAVFQEVQARAPPRLYRIAWLGDSSYSLYLLHVLLIDCILMALAKIDTSAINTANRYFWLVGLSFFLVIVCIVPYELVERTLVRRLQRVAKARFAEAHRVGSSL